jgi:UDP-glucose 4-epimerase
MLRRNIILGGLGFIGRNLTDTLLLQNESVLIIDNNVHNLDWHMGEFYKSNSKFKVEIKNCADAESLSQMVRDFQPDQVFHLAANSDIGRNDSILYDFQNTLLTTLALCEVLRIGVKIPSILFASSSAIYGDSVHPMSINGNEICAPINTYGWAKIASELSLRGACNLSGTELKIARFPNVVGPHLTHGLLFDLISKRKNLDKSIEILGDGTQKKPFVHVSELIDILVQRKTKDSAIFEVFNITPTDQITVKEIVDIFSSIIPESIKFSYQIQRHGWQGDVPEYLFDVEEARLFQTVVPSTSLDAVTRSIYENL